MKDAFIFETEAEDSYAQEGEYSYEDFEGDFESDYEADFEGDFESDYENDFEGEDFEYNDEVRGRVRMPARGRSIAFRPVRRVGPFRPVARVPYRFRPGTYRYNNLPYRWRTPGLGYRPGFGYYRRGAGYYPYGAAGYPPQPGMASDQSPMGSDSYGSPLQPSKLVMILQRLLNRTIGANLPVDGVMSVETRSALRSFQSQASQPSPPAAAPPPPETPPPAGADAGAPPQAEYDELAFLENEFDEFGY